MKIHTYKLGNWIQHDYDLPDWPEGIESFEEYLKLCRFYSHPISWGSEDEDEHIMFYENIDENDLPLGTSWLADIPTISSSFYFYIPNHPSFLMFKKEYKHLYEKQKKSDFIDVDGVIVNKKYVKSVTKHWWTETQIATLDCVSDDDNYCRFTKTIKCFKKEGKPHFPKSVCDWVSENFDV